MAKFFKKRNGRRSNLKPRRKNLRNSRKRVAPRKSLRKTRKRSRSLSTHIISNGVKETVVANKRSRRNRPKDTSTNIYQIPPIGTQISVQSLTQNYQVFYSGSRSQLNSALQTTAMNTGVTGNNVNTTNIYWQTYRQEFLFTNTTNTTCIVKINIYNASDDSTSSFASQWIGGMMDEQGNTTDNSQIYGVEPEMSQRLRQFWRRKYTKEYTMAPGATLKHTWVNKINKRINNQLLLDSDNYMRNITQAMLVLVRGTAATDAVNASLVDTTPVKLDVIYTQRASYTYVQDATTNLLFSSGSGTGAVNNAVQVINTLGVDPAYNAVTAAGY